MRTLSFIAAATLAAVAVPAAAAVNLVQNGSFETGFVKSTEFGKSFAEGVGPTGWSSPSSRAYNLYLDPKTASTVSAANRFGASNERLSLNFTGASPDGGYFVGLDGDVDFSGPLRQTVGGLTAGKRYNVDFFWAATQLRNRSGATTEKLQVSFGDVTQTTAIAAIPTQGFSGWMAQNFTFTASNTSQVLSFLSVGTPSGLPPIALLDGVSVTAVPEPATWAMMLAGFAMVGAAVRRRRPLTVCA